MILQKAMQFFTKHLLPSGNSPDLTDIKRYLMSVINGAEGITFDDVNISAIVKNAVVTLGVPGFRNCFGLQTNADPDPSLWYFGTFVLNSYLGGYSAGSITRSMGITTRFQNGFFTNKIIPCCNAGLTAAENAYTNVNSYAYLDNVLCNDIAVGMTGNSISGSVQAYVYFHGLLCKFS